MKFETLNDWFDNLYQEDYRPKYLYGMVSNSTKIEKRETEGTSQQYDGDIFARMKAGELIRLNDPQYFKVQDIVNRTIELSARLKNAWIGASATILPGVTIGENAIVAAG